MDNRERAMRLAVLASIVIVVAGFGYLFSLLLNIPAGFPMPPTTATRVMASLSVFGSAPALAAFAYAMRGLRPTRATNLAFATSVTFAVVALANRFVQLVAVQIWPETGLPQFDLYVPNSFAQGAEMLAWGLLFGIVTVLLAKAVRVTVGAWPARLIETAGLMSLAAALVYVMTMVATPPAWVGGVAVAVGGLAWGIVWPASAALFISVTRSRRAFA